MQLDHIEDLSRFVDELHRETDRGLPLVGAALIDAKLLETLESFFVEGKAAKHLLTEAHGPLSSFSARIDACFALGLIDEFEYHEISLIRKIRNEFAHTKHGLTFQSEKLKSLSATLKSDLPKDAGHPIDEPRFRLINAIVCIVLRLYYRPDWVKKERRALKEWMPADASKWRSVKDEPPPAGMPVMVIGRVRNPKT